MIAVPHEVWWQTMVDRGYAGVDGLFVHPVEDEAVMAGNGTIGLELCEELAAFDAVVVPWGGGGLTTGIASAVKALRPGTRVVTAEPDTAAPLAASFAAGGAGRDRLHARRSSTAPADARCCRRCGTALAALVDAAVAVPLDEVAAAMRLLADARPRRRRGRRRARARRSAARGRRRGPGRLHRQRREHRRRRPREGADRRDAPAGLVPSCHLAGEARPRCDSLAL